MRSASQTRPLRMWAVLALAALVVFVSEGFAPTPASAAIVPGDIYRGQSTDLSTVYVTVSPDGQSVKASVGYEPRSVAFFSPFCPGGFVFTSIPIIAGTASAAVAGPTTVTEGEGRERNIKLDIRFGPDGIATGSYSSEADWPTSCKPRQMKFTVATNQPGYPPVAGGTYRGTTAEGYQVAFRVTADGKRTEQLRLITGDNCTSIDTGTTVLDPIKPNSEATVSSPGGVTIEGGGVAYFVMFFAGPEVRGTLVSTSSCGTPISTSFTATASAGAGTLTAPPPQNYIGPGDGTLKSGAIGRNGGIGLMVFTGGTNEQLVRASGCPAAAAVFWFTDVGGVFVTYVPGTTVSAVNAAWFARFPDGVQYNAILGRCTESGGVPAVIAPPTVAPSPTASPTPPPAPTPRAAQPPVALNAGMNFFDRCTNEHVEIAAPVVQMSVIGGGGVSVQVQPPTIPGYSGGETSTTTVNLDSSGRGRLQRIFVLTKGTQSRVTLTYDIEVRLDGLPTGQLSQSSGQCG